MAENFRVLCVITSAHGVHGRIKIKPFTEDPEGVTAYGPLMDATGNRYKLKITSVAGNMLIGAIDGIKDRNEAEKLRGLQLGVDRSALPKPEEGEYYLDDLMGLRVLHEDGAAYGTLRAIQNYGAGDIAEITLENGKTELLPFNEATFPIINVAEGCMVVKLPEVVKAEDQSSFPESR